ncbi:hypothetical protein [Psychromicrobium sp. YIM B11713]|uniref:hypothetical protein n=1 Tax=Psychromicrobium sp. YIM B11713 TaxID=3145233 RepID=UPI00374E3E0D
MLQQHPEGYSLAVLLILGLADPGLNYSERPASISDRGSRSTRDSSVYGNAFGGDTVLGIPEFARLPADAGENTRDQVTERLIPVIRDLWERYPVLSQPGSELSGGAAHAEHTIRVTLEEVDNVAQFDVLKRAGERLLSMQASGTWNQAAGINQKSPWKICN